MTRLLLALSVAVLVAAFQLSLSGPISAFSGAGADMEGSYKCEQTDWCTTPLPDVRNWECAEGLLDHCSESTTAQGCKKCAASSTPPGGS